MTVQQQIVEWDEQQDCIPNIPPDLLKAIVDTDTIVDLHFYPDTPIGSYRIIHHDLEAALDEALTILGLT